MRRRITLAVADPARRRGSAAAKSSGALGGGAAALTALSWLPFGAVFLFVASTFAFRNGLPGFRHDWTWPATSHGFVRWFVDNGISQWDPHGFGTAGQIPTINFVLGGFATLGACGMSPQSILFVAAVAFFTASLCGVLRLFSAFDFDLDPIAARALAAAYALSPIAFEKAVAGHLFWLGAYAALPWFVSAVRYGCRNDARIVKSFAAAALLYAFSTTQIQFLVFDAFVMIVVVAVYAPRSRAWLGVGAVLLIGALHNINAILAPFRPVGEFALDRSHGTVAWETGMSGKIVDLATFGGYFGYNTAALSGGWLAANTAGNIALLVIGVAGIVLARDRRAIVFAFIGCSALAVGSGWNGPLRLPLSWALEHSSFFTLFRELYHIEALYALAAIACAAMALSRAGVFSRPLSVIVLILVSLPFTTLGLPRMVATVVPLPIELVRGKDDGTRQILLPYQEPISAPGLSTGGADPARFVVDDVASGDPPLALRSVLDQSLDDADRQAILADLGISRVSWRVGRISLIANGFEPGVGATFATFESTQRRLREKYSDPVALGEARAPLQLEKPKSPNPFAAFVADDQIAPGRSVPLESSFEDNDIRRRWVAGHLWSWFAPEEMNVLGEPILTMSTAEEAVALNAGPGDTVYVLAVARGLTLDGRRGESFASVSGSRYSWYRWTLDAPIAVGSLRAQGGLTSIARCVVSHDATWRPSGARESRPRNAIRLDTVQTFPWSLAAVIPKTNEPLLLVYARTFTPDWHLFINGTDIGPPRRSDGLFNGWDVPAANVPRSMSLVFTPQLRSGVFLLVDCFVEIGLLGLIVFTRPMDHA